MIDVQENTELTANYLDLTVDTFSLRLDQLTDIIQSKLEDLSGAIRSDANITQNIASNETERDRNLFENLQVTFSTKLDDLVGFMRGNQLEDLERRREEKEPEVQEFPDQEDSNELLTSLLEGFSDIIETVATGLKIILAPIASIIGTIVGVFKGYVDSVKAIALTLSNIVKLFTRGRVNLQASFNSLVSQFVSFGKTLANLFKSVTKTGAVGSIAGFFAQVSTRLSAIGSSLKNALLPIIETFSKASAFIRQGFQSVSNSLGPIGKALGAVRGLLNSILRGVRTFVPFLNFFFITFETVKGIFKGFKEGGFLGALEGGIKGFLDGFIAIPLDLLKGALAFLADALGMETVANALRSFSFSDIIGSLVSIPFNMLNDIGTWLSKQFGFDKSKGIIENMLSMDYLTGLITLPYDLVRSVVGWIAGKLGFDKAEEILNSFSFTDLIESMATAPFELFEKIRDYLVEKVRDLAGFIVKLLPKPLKSFLGIDGEGSNEGEEEESSNGGSFFSRLNPFSNDDEVSGGTGTSVAAGDELQMEGEARRDAELERSQLGRVGGPGSNAVNVATNVQNNSNTTTQTRPSASSQPDNMSDTMILAGA